MTLFQRLPRGGHTRSLSEHGSQAPHRRWYLAHGPGRVGRRWIHGAPCLKGEGLLFLYTAPLRYALATMPGQYRALVAHGPLMVNRRGGFFVLCASARMNFISPLAITTGQYRSLMAQGPLPSDGERGPSFFFYRFCKSIVPLRRGSRHPWRAFRFFFRILLTIRLR